MAHAGVMSPDGKHFAYNPLAPAFLFNFTNYVSWGNYRGGLASTIRITSLPGLDSVEVPHDITADISPAWAGGKLYFLSARAGPISIFSYDPATKAVSEVHRNTGADIRSLSSDGQTLVRALIHYVCIDLETGRAKRMPPEFTNYTVAPDVAEAMASATEPFQPGVEPHCVVTTLELVIDRSVTD